MAKINKDGLDPQVVAYIDSLEEDTEQLEAALSDVTDVAETLKAENDGLKAKLAKHDVAEADTDEAFEEVIKSAPAHVAEVMKAQRRQMQEQAEHIAKMQQADVERTMLAKAAALPYLQGTPDEVAAVLKECYEVPSVITKSDGTTETKTLGDKVEAMLKAANAQLESAAIFSQVGTAGATTTVSKSLEAAAGELRKADPTLTQEQAIAQALDNNPEMYAEYIASQEA